MPSSESAPRPRRCPDRYTLTDGHVHVRSAPAEVSRRPHFRGAGGGRLLRARGGVPSTTRKRTAARRSAPRPRRCPARGVRLGAEEHVRSAPAEVSLRPAPPQWADPGPLRARGGVPDQQMTTYGMTLSAPRPRRCPGPRRRDATSAWVRSAPAEVSRASGWWACRPCRQLRARGGVPAASPPSPWATTSAPCPRRCPAVQVGDDRDLDVRSAPAEVSRSAGRTSSSRARPLRAAVSREAHSLRSRREGSRSAK